MNNYSSPVKCPLCLEEVKFCSILETHYDSQGGQTYQLYECPCCEGQFWTPFKSPGAVWYEKDERYSGANRSPSLAPNWNHRKTISLLKHKTGSVLDVGCGTGNFLAWAKQQGWETVGLDFDANAVQTAKEIFKLPNIELVDIVGYEARYPEKKFDLITFFDVIEHLDNHLEFFRAVRMLLKPQGYIAMSLPYRGGARFLQPNDLPPRHLTRWDEKSLRTFLERQGFKVLYLKKQVASLSYLVMKMRFYFGPLFSWGLVKKIKAKEDASLTEGLVPPRESLKIRFARAAARLKDYLFFGLPAFFLWCFFLLTEKRYIGLYVLAQKKDEN